MNTQELLSLSIEKLAPLIERRQVSPLELTDLFLERIEKLNPKVNAYITVLNEQARTLAKKAEEEIVRGDYKGPLHGIPLAVKDNIDMNGIRTTQGSKIHKDYVPRKDATVVTRLLNAGMIPIGKTNLHEYALGVTTVNPHYKPTYNPWNLQKIAGGSSGGSAAALAADMATAALGTDTGGSVRIPSACCGTVGLKPTYGRVHKKGVFPLAWTLDHVGPMTKTVKDAALMLQAMTDFDLKDKRLSDDIRGMVIGIPEEAYQVEASVLVGMEKMIKQLEMLGAHIQNVSIPALEHVPYVANVITCTEASAIHHEQLIKRPFDFGEDVGTILKLGELITGVQYVQAQQLRRVIHEELSKVFHSVNAIMTPMIPVPAPDINQKYVQINGEGVDVTEAFTLLPSIANVAGLPSLAMPSGLTNSGLPIGIQLIGKMYDEQTILNIGYQIEDPQILNSKKPLH